MTDTIAPGSIPEETDFHRLSHFPITFFAIVMGVMGLVLALHSAHTVLPWTASLAQGGFFAGVAIFAVIAAFYLAKLLRHPSAVKGEWNHPVRLAFFPAVSVSLLLTATACYTHYPQLAWGLWGLGRSGREF